MNRPTLSQLLLDATRKANEERDQAKQVERITAIVKAKLAHAHKAEAEETCLRCPVCGAERPESEFEEVEPDDDGDADGFRTDPVTSGTTNDDDQNVGDRPAKYDNRKLTPLERALKSKGIDPFAED